MTIGVIRRFLAPAAAATFLCMPASAGTVPMMDGCPEDDVNGSPGWARDRAYAAAGVGFKRCLMDVKFPSSGRLQGRKPFAFEIDWKRQFVENRDRMPYCQWSRLDLGNGISPVYTVFNVRYLAGSDDWFDQYFAKITGIRYLKKEEINKILNNEREIRENSLVFFIGFPEDKVKLVYYPGELKFRGGDAIAHPWLAGTPESIKRGARTDHKLIQNSEGLLALINGTFYTEDNFSLYGRKGFKYGGFGFDYKVMMKPEPRMATVALYDDGRLRMGSYRNLPDRDRIRTFVQNKYMVLENGEYGRDASPPHFTRYDDMIARSYLFKHASGLIGYLWTMNLPPQVTAKLAKDMGITDMLILDIHSPISCQVSLPGSPLFYRSWREFKSHSFNFVPVFEDESRIIRSLIAISRALEKNVQTDYRREAFVRGVKDYFAVFADGSPEAARISQPRILQARLSLTGHPEGGQQ